MSAFVVDAGVVSAVMRTPDASDDPTARPSATVEVVTVPADEFESARTYVLELFSDYAVFAGRAANRLPGLTVLFGGHLRSEPEAPLVVAVTSFAVALGSLDLLLEGEESG